jgi:hypothetical protein
MTETRSSGSSPIRLFEIGAQAGRLAVQEFGVEASELGTADMR